MRNKNGFTLVELLVTISIMSVLLIISFPSINKFISKNNRETYETYREMLRAAGKTYFENLGYIISGCYEIKYSDLINAELISSTSKDVSKSIVYVNTDTDGNAIEYKVNLYDKDNKIILSPEFTDSTCEYEVLEYKDGYGGDRDKTVNKPHLDGYLVPIKYKNGQWVVADINNIKISTFENDYSWYDYPKGYPANGAYMKNMEANNKYRKNNKFIIGKEVDTKDVLNTFVWIPEFSYNNDTKDLKYIIKGASLEEGYTIPDGFKDLSNNILDGIWVTKTPNNDDKNIFEMLNYSYNYDTGMNSHANRTSENDLLEIAWTYFRNHDYHTSYRLSSTGGFDGEEYNNRATKCKTTYSYSAIKNIIPEDCGTSKFTHLNSLNDKEIPSACQPKVGSKYFDFEYDLICRTGEDYFTTGAQYNLNDNKQAPKYQVNQKYYTASCTFISNISDFDTSIDYYDYIYNYPEKNKPYYKTSIFTKKANIEKSENMTNKPYSKYLTFYGSDKGCSPEELPDSIKNTKAVKDSSGKLIGYNITNNYSFVTDAKNDAPSYSIVLW